LLKNISISILLFAHLEKLLTQEAVFARVEVSVSLWSWTS